MRGCLQKAKTKRPLPKGEFAWNIILSLGRGADGKYKQKWERFYGNRRQAEQKLTELTGEVHRGEFVHSSKLTVGMWLDEWIEKAIRPPRCAMNTYKSYLGMARKHVKPHLGHIPLQQLTSLQVERYYADRGEVLPPRSVATHHAMLTTALTAAVSAGLVRQNVASRATNKPKIRMHEDLLTNVWSVEEARRFLSAVKATGDVQMQALFALALDSGLRKGELLGLQWRDLTGASLRVERQLLGMTTDESGVCVPDTSLPKGKSARSIDLSEDTLILLRDHRRSQAEIKLKNRLRYTDFGLIFAQSWEDQRSDNAGLGWPLSRTSIGTWLDRVCDDSGVKRITPHGLRHSCATLLLAAGVPANVVQRRLGHRRVEMTLNVYSHVLPSMQADAAGRLAALLHG